MANPFSDAPTYPETAPTTDPTPSSSPSPEPTRKKRASKVAGFTKSFGGIQNDVGNISLPSFTSDTGAVIALIGLNMAWSVFREFASNPEADSTLGAASPLHGSLVKIVTGAWVVGLGLLLVHEVDPHVAMLLALLFVIGNILSNNAGNKAAINALNTVFVGKKGA